MELPTVVTVTELKRRELEEEFEEQKQREYEYSDLLSSFVEDKPAGLPKIITKPKFLEEKRGLNAAEKGTAMHDAMQYLDLNQVSNLKEIDVQLDEMVEKELITQEQREVVNSKKILEFYSSALGRRISDALPKVFREVSFAYNLKAKDIFKNLDDSKYDTEEVKLQGIIDLYFEEDGKVVLVDYKTDYVEEGKAQEVVDRYTKQLQYYAKAIEAIIGKMVKEKYIYLFNDRHGQKVYRV